MLTALCALATLVPGAPAPSFDLALEVGATRLVAHNPSELPELVLISDPASRRRASFVVPARGRVELRFAAGSLHGLELRIGRRDDTGLHLSAAWSLERLADAGECVWFDVEQHPFHAWGRDARGSHVLTASEAPAGPPPGSVCAPPPPASHVPVVSPHDARKPDLPPRLETKPLPPV